MSLREHYENLDQYAIYDYKDVKNAYGHGEWDAIDRVLKIIDSWKEFHMGAHKSVLNMISNEVLALKGGEQE